MATQAQILANQMNAQSSTGPRTPDGKARSAANSQTMGLFSKKNSVTHEEATEFAALQAGLLEEMQPGTIVEHALVTEILHSLWRLRRCALVEDKLEPSERPDEDPAQLAIDRARAQANIRIRRNTEALCRLQTQRKIRQESSLENQGLINIKEVLTARLLNRKVKGLHTFEAIMRAAFDKESDTGSTADFAKRTQFESRQTPPPPQKQPIDEASPNAKQPQESPRQPCAAPNTAAGTPLSPCAPPAGRPSLPS